MLISCDTSINTLGTYKKKISFSHLDKPNFKEFETDLQVVFSGEIKNETSLANDYGCITSNYEI